MNKTIIQRVCKHTDLNLMLFKKPYESLNDLECEVIYNIWKNIADITQPIGGGEYIVYESKK